ncbi:MAG: DedA family protein [Desulfobacteraceae bacterium]|jgi:membrane protein DedA with SNARE-associated domain|nr:DedA family protein [Desulfobacteraceae bacterium]
MTTADFIAAYGYAAVFFGALVEGEAVLIVAVMLARQGCLDISAVMAAALLGAFCGDLLLFGLGRIGGQALLARRPLWQVRLKRAQGLERRCRLPLIVGFRFLYGLRTVIPLAIGMGPIGGLRFLLLDAVGVSIWAGLTAAAGVLLADVWSVHLAALPHGSWALLAVVPVVLGLWWALCRRPKTTSKKAPVFLLRSPSGPFPEFPPRG